MDANQISDSAFQIVSFAGDARSRAMEAVSVAKDGNIDMAKSLIDEARELLVEAHHHQTDLISAEANGEDIQFSVLLIHGQDHLMTAMTVVDLAEELVDVHARYGK